MTDEMVYDFSLQLQVAFWWWMNMDFLGSKPILLANTVSLWSVAILLQSEPCKIAAPG